MAAPRKPVTESPYLDEDHQRISEFAETYFDDPEEREEFLGTLMERRGYKRVQHTSWEPPDPPEKDEGQPPAAKRATYFKRG